MKMDLSHTMVDSGFYLSVERHPQTLLIRVKAVGRPSTHDYLRLEPQLEAALYSINTPKVNALVDLSELGSLSFHNIWEDILWMRQYSTEFDRIALYNPRPWHLLISRVFGWYMKGDIQTFTDYQQAVNWSHAH